MLAMAADHDSSDGPDIVVIACPADRDVGAGRHESVGGIEIDPTEVRYENANPGVGDIGAQQAALSRRRRGDDIAADVPGGEAERAKTAELEVREILTH